jgi:hypothetical protein
LLAQETSAITTTESAETRIIAFFMAGTLVDNAGQFNRRTPGAVTARNHFLVREMRIQGSVKNYMSDKIVFTRSCSFRTEPIELAEIVDIESSAPLIRIV